MQEAKALPTLGDDFAALCERSIEDCLRRVLSVAAQRAQFYDSLAGRHSDLVEFVESVDTE